MAGIPGGAFGSTARPSNLSHTVTVVFPADVYRTLEDLARSTGRPIEQVLVDAINREKWYQDTIRSGKRVLVANGSVVFDVSSPR